jgi:hypothetical protein
MANGTRWPSHWYGSGVWNLPDPNYPCGKYKFQSKADAKLAIRHVRAQKPNWQRREGKPTAYKCKNCGLWHWGHKRGKSDGVRAEGVESHAG